jgi:hypothetical protein
VASSVLVNKNMGSILLLLPLRSLPGSDFGMKGNRKENLSTMTGFATGAVGLLEIVPRANFVQARLRSPE